jgi:Pyruvate/2-oxoacid:ferredoxin oxidoreductase delta subunit
MTNKSIITIYCNCSYYDFVPQKNREAVIESMVKSNIQFESVSDLCLLAARKDPVLQKWAKFSNIRIIACFPRAVKWLFNAADAQLPDKNVEFFNMRTQTPKDITIALSASTEHGQKKQSPEFEKSSDWVPWFPVIDNDRCKNCRQCMNFCLFGVYELSSENKIQVRNPTHCKTNCPACARVCPHQAIIFPKYSEAPINGDQVLEDQLKKSELSDALHGNVYDAIRQRSKGKKRFAGTAEDQITAESPASASLLQKTLKIPAEVLSSLTPAEIQKIREKTGKK